MSPIRRFLYILTLTFMWAPSFLFIKLAVQELPAFTIVASRTILATIGFLGILVWYRRKLPTDWKFWANSFVLAIISMVVPFSLFCFAEQSIDSALAAIFNGSTPMFTAFLSHLFIPSDRMNLQKGIGVATSAFGLILLFSPNIEEGLSGTTTGLIAAATASFSYAAAHIYAKKYSSGLPQYVAPTAQLIMTVLVLVPMALYFDQAHTLSFPSTPVFLSVCGLAFFGTFMAGILYYKLLDYSGPTALSMSACFFPIGGMLLGFIFLGETFTFLGFIATGIILLGMMLVNGLIRLPMLESKPVQA